MLVFHRRPKPLGYLFDLEDVTFKDGYRNKVDGVNLPPDSLTNFSSWKKTNFESRAYGSCGVIGLHLLCTFPKLDVQAPGTLKAILGDVQIQRAALQRPSLRFASNKSKKMRNKKICCRLRLRTKLPGFGRKVSECIAKCATCCQVN